MNILEYLVDHFEICWKEHADAPIPEFNEEQINIFDFNNDNEEPLRDKFTSCDVVDNKIKIYWKCQEEWYDLTGMKEEITRWAEYWINKYKKKINTNIDKIGILVLVEDRDGCMSDAFEITI